MYRHVKNIQVYIIIQASVLTEENLQISNRLLIIRTVLNPNGDLFGSGYVVKRNKNLGYVTDARFLPWSRVF